MQQVNELLDFNINTPSDKELVEAFENESARLHEGMKGIHNKYNPLKQEISLPATTRNQKKRAHRKARGHA